MKKGLVFVAAGFLLLGTACSTETQDTSGGNEAAEDVTLVDCPTPDSDGVVKIQEGLVARITRKGYGRAAQSLDIADVHANLWLYDPDAEGGRGLEVWSTQESGPYQFQIDVGSRIDGWDLGIKCMLLGEKRELIIAPELAYGEKGRPPVPPNASLLYEIDLLRLNAPQ